MKQLRKMNRGAADTAPAGTKEIPHTGAHRLKQLVTKIRRGSQQITERENRNQLLKRGTLPMSWTEPKKMNLLLAKV
jgi:hypothetical protein